MYRLTMELMVPLRLQTNLSLSCSILLSVFAGPLLAQPFFAPAIIRHTPPFVFHLPTNETQHTSRTLSIQSQNIQSLSIQPQKRLPQSRPTRVTQPSPVNQHVHSAAIKKAIPTKGRIAIIIDDLGNGLRKGLDALALPGHITYAILPHRKHSQSLARRGHRLNKEIMLHIPMSTMNGRALGAGALIDELSETEFKNRLQHAINSLPHIKGVNNHMGSRLTQNGTAMLWVMDVLREEQLFFVDSRTTAQTVAFQVAQQSGIHSATRDVFLDHKVDIDHIHQQFKRALAVALKHGTAVVIGHPHKETIEYLREVIPQLTNLGVQLNTVSQIMAYGIHTRPLPSGFEPPAQVPSLDSLVQVLMDRNAKNNAL